MPGTYIPMIIINTNLIFLHSGIVCHDYEGWVDSDGYGCDEYNGCEDAAQYANADGIDALSACCKCGGGNGMRIPYSIFCHCFIIFHIILERPYSMPKL